MHPANILSGAAFKAAVFALVVFVLALTGVGTALYHINRTAMYAELKAQIAEELILFRQIQKEGGQEALIGSLRKLEQAEFPGQRIGAVFDQSGTKLAGNLEIAHDFVALRTASKGFFLQQKNGKIYAQSDKIGSGILIVGRNLRLVNATEDALLKSLLVAGFTVVILSLAIGYGLSRSVFVRLEAMAATLDRIARGDMHARLPVSIANDQIDRISLRINEHLERLSVLMQSTRNAVNAIAHDLRTPLGRVSLILQEAAGGSDTEKPVEELLMEAEEELAQLTGTFDTILRVSKIESSSDPSAFTVFPVADLVRDMAETMEPVVEEAGHRLFCNTRGTDDLNVFGDRKMVRQMLVNLIENSVSTVRQGQ